MKLKKIKIPTYIKSALYISGALTLGATQVQAAAGFDAVSFKPASDQGYYLTVEQSQTLKAGGFSLGIAGEYAKSPFLLKDAAGNNIQDVISKEFTATAGASLGLLNWLNVGATVTGVPYQNFTTPGTLASDNGGRMGDVIVNAKLRLLDNEKGPIGISLVPYVTIPTGSENHFTGNGKVAGGGTVILDTKRIDDHLSLSLNAGALFRSDVTLAPTSRTIGHQFNYGAAANLAIIKPVQVIAEATGWTTFDNFFGSNNNNLELNGGLRFLPAGDNSPVAVTVGGGTGLMKDNPGAPDWRVFSMISFRHPRRDEVQAEVAPAAEPVREEVITTNQIHFAFNKAVIQPESHKVLEDILADIQSRPEVETVRIEGHTDSIGTDEANQKLSEKRANAVRSFLVDRGYPSEKIIAVGMGETSPISDNETKDGRAQNRRVEFHLQLQQGAHVKVQKQKTAPTFEEGDPGDRAVKRRRSNSL